MMKPKCVSRSCKNMTSQSIWWWFHTPGLATGFGKWPGGFQSHGGTPKSSKSLDHDLVLKPMVTWGIIHLKKRVDATRIYQWWRFPEIEVPRNHPFQWDFPLKTIHFRDPHLWNPPNERWEQRLRRAIRLSLAQPSSHPAALRAMTPRGALGHPGVLSGEKSCTSW